MLRMMNISKRFGPVTVLHDINFEIFAGEVHVLAGENGAGKSTLIKILTGVHTDFDGTITFEDRFIRPSSPNEANQIGIAAIYQELSMVPSMSVADNLFLGRAKTVAGFIDESAQHREARQILAQLDVELDAGQLVEELPIAVQQMLEIAKALSVKAKVIIMDEPTSALNEPEVKKLFGLIDDLKARGCGIVYITHKMEEIEQIADRITVLRDGKHIGTERAADLPAPKLIHMMVGRDIDQQFPRHQTSIGEPRLTVENFNVFSGKHRHKPVVENVSFSVGAGEILGIGGLQGSGASQLLMGLFGAYGKNIRGHVTLHGQSVHITSPGQAITNGVALLTNDRKSTGLVLSMSIIANTTMADMPRCSPFGFFNRRKERSAAEEMAKALRLRAASLEMDVASLSGGNQQKVALAKWLHVNPRVLLLDEPTRGIDIGSKQEVYQLMNEWTAEGIAIVLITSEMPELLAMSDRIIVMHRGRITAECTRETATPEFVLEAAMGKIHTTVTNERRN